MAVLQAVFRKFLSATKNKMKQPHIKVQSQGGAAGSYSPDDAVEFEQQKQDWQEELDTMSEFLVLKSTEEQKDDGVEDPVDTACIGDREGFPVLRARFDVHHFTKEEIDLRVEGDQLLLDAQTTDDRDTAIFRKTMIRKLDLPNNVNKNDLSWSIDDEGILTAELPFLLPQPKKPRGPNVFPVVKDEDGKKRIRLGFMVGPDFTEDDIMTEMTVANKLVVRAAYDAEIGKYGKQVRQRELRQQFSLPEHIHVDTVNHTLTPEGRLLIELVLHDDPPYKCEVTTEEIL